MPRTRMAGTTLNRPMSELPAHTVVPRALSLEHHPDFWDSRDYRRQLEETKRMCADGARYERLLLRQIDARHVRAVAEVPIGTPKELGTVPLPAKEQTK
jgi:hypothetical protein